MNLDVVFIYGFIWAVKSSLRSCCNLEPFFNGNKQVSVEASVTNAEIVFRGFATSDMTIVEMLEASSRGHYGVLMTHFQLVNTYKGVETLTHFGNANDMYSYRSVKVEFKAHGAIPNCLNEAGVPVEYVYFSQNYTDTSLIASAIIRWNENVDSRIWSFLGWRKWSEWSTCSSSCSRGIQQRIRHCQQTPKCPGFNVEQRHCNLFTCSDSIDLLSSQIGESLDKTLTTQFWQPVPNRPTAWRLSTKSYVWVPSSHLIQPLFQQFTLFTTIRIIEKNNLGTVFSIRSRHQESYLSLEAIGYDLRLLHACGNGTNIVRIPIILNDQKWHQLAISIRQTNIVQVYVDCEWRQTHILNEHSMDIPQDADLIIGYLFSGDLEQLTINSNPQTVSLQCSSSRTPIYDSAIQN